jgi:hypothetical protein
LQAAKNQDFERALQEFECFPWIVYRRHPTCLRLSGILVKRLANDSAKHGDRPRRHQPQSQFWLPVRMELEPMHRPDQVPVNGIPSQKNTSRRHQ